VLGEAYRDKKILLTGGTGFLGTALVEKILRSLPDLGCLYLLVRPSREKGAAERFEKDMLGSAAFRGLRERLGDGFAEYAASKVRVLEGDVHAGSLGLGEDDLAELSREVDVVIHSAASVVFRRAARRGGGLERARYPGPPEAGARVGEEAAVHAHLYRVRRGEHKGGRPGGAAGETTPNGTVLDAREEILGLDAVVAEVD
jgi:hypothetical protein